MVLRCTVQSAFAALTDESAQVAWLYPAEALSRMTPADAARVNDTLGDDSSRAGFTTGPDGTDLLTSAP